ncbi:MAG: hypothetical protein H6742_06285 [Alphaproteobacteria bacterium]|nr:hypothetical protein [Alphaproteobacteria bacterium]
MSMVALLATAVLLSGCSGEPGPTVDPAAPALPDGWIGALVADPTAFGRVTGDARGAWVALHHGDLTTAAQGFGQGIGAHRAWREQAELHGDLAELSGWTWTALHAEWTAQDPTVADGPLTLLAALAAADAGDAEGARALAAALPPAQQSLVDELLAAGRADVAEADVDVPDLDDGGCLGAALAARLSADGVELPAGCDGSAPLALGEGEARFHDPLLHGTLARSAARSAEDALGQSWPERIAASGAGLDDLVFGVFWTDADLAAYLADPRATLSLDEIAGWTADGATSDDPQQARDQARRLDAALDAWAAARRDGASDDGRALLDDLKLVPQVRARTLERWARQALHNGRPHQALAWLQMAVDLESARELGPINRPSLYALLAQARARTGRTREALDALAVLEPAVPEVHALTETLGDLVVLQGMRRQGDSKEH